MIGIASLPVHAAELVVIAVTGSTDIAPGARLDDGKAIELSDGVSLTMLSQSGAIIKLKGPHSGPPVASSSATAGSDTNWSNTLTGVNRLVGKSPKTSNVMGASRQVEGAEFNDPSDGIWLMAVESSGHRCVRAAGAEMWRFNTDTALKIDLRSDNARLRGLEWAEGQPRLALPNQFIEDGTLIVMKFGKNPRRFNLHVLPEHIEVEGWGRILRWMLEQQCDRQAQILVDALHEDVISAE